MRRSKSERQPDAARDTRPANARAHASQQTRIAVRAISILSSRQRTRARPCRRRRSPTAPSRRRTARWSNGRSQKISTIDSCTRTKWAIPRSFASASSRSTRRATRGRAARRWAGAAGPRRRRGRDADCGRDVSRADGRRTTRRRVRAARLARHPRRRRGRDAMATRRRRDAAGATQRRRDTAPTKSRPRDAPRRTAATAEPRTHRSKIKEVDFLMEKYKGSELELYRAVKAKYRGRAEISLVGSGFVVCCKTSRGDAAATTWIFRGDESRRHRRGDDESRRHRRGDVEIRSRPARASGTRRGSRPRRATSSRSSSASGPSPVSYSCTRTSSALRTASPCGRLRQGCRCE